VSGKSGVSGPRRQYFSPLQHLSFHLGAAS
jgi:hypothetical protein